MKHYQKPNYTVLSLKSKLQGYFWHLILGCFKNPGAAQGVPPSSLQVLLTLFTTSGGEESLQFW